MADPLSISAGVTSLLAFASTALSQGYTIVQSYKQSGAEVNRLLVELSQLTGILAAVDAQERKTTDEAINTSVAYGSVSEILNASIVECRKTLQSLEKMLNKLDKSGKLVRSVQWQLKGPEVQSMALELSRYRETFTLCLGFKVRTKVDKLFDLEQEMVAAVSRIEAGQRQEQDAAKALQAKLQLQALYKWLAADISEKHSRISNMRVKGSGSWLLEHPDYLAWSRGEEALLWLNGIPGSGKTLLFSCIIDDLKNRLKAASPSLALSYSYCSYSDSHPDRVVSVLSSLAVHLIRLSESPHESPAMTLFQKCEEGNLSPSREELLNLLVELINSFSLTYICLDAIDEYRSDDKEEILAMLYMLIERTENVKILVCTRSGDLDTLSTLEGCLSISITPDCLSSDIGSYIKFRLQRGPSRLKKLNVDETVQKLTAGAQGMFLWVTCQLDLLTRAKTTLDTLPKSLYDTYDRILREIDIEHKQLAARTLAFLAHAAEPLALDELTEGIFIDESVTSLATMGALLNPEDIFQICGSLICRSDPHERISLAHHSIYEYLTLEVFKTRIPEPFFIPKTESTLALSSACLRYLSFPEFREAGFQIQMELDYDNVTLQRPGKSEISADSAIDTTSSIDRPFFDYALKHWWKHPQRANVESLWPSISRFIDPKTGNFSQCALMLRYLYGSEKYPRGLHFIHFCAMHDLVALLERTLKEYSDCVNLRAEDGRTALHIAIALRHEPSINALLSNFADPSLSTFSGVTPLQIALEAGDEGIIQLLIKSGANVNSRLAGGETMLSAAIENSADSIIFLLLDFNADPNGLLEDGRRPIHIAAGAGVPRYILEALAHKGAEISSLDKNDWCALHFAAHNDHVDTTELLLDPELLLAASTAKGKQQLSKPDEAGKGESGSEVQPLGSGHRFTGEQASEYPRIMFESQGYTPLHAAVQQQNLEIIKLFKPYANCASNMINQITETQQNPEDRRRIPAMRPLPLNKKGGLNQGPVSPSPMSSQAVTASPGDPQEAFRASKQEQSIVQSPLFMAVSQSFNTGVELLLDAGVCTKDFDMCLALALNKSKLSILKIMLQKTKRPEILLLDLHERAVKNKGLEELVARLFQSLSWNLEILDLLINSVKPSECNHRLFAIAATNLIRLRADSPVGIGSVIARAFEKALLSENLDLANALFENGADPYAVEHLLHKAVNCQSAKALSFLLEKCPGLISSFDSHGQTALHIAASNAKYLDHVLVLLSEQADLSIEDIDGNTPLLLAIRSRLEETVICLLSAGADVSIPDKNGKTALHVAAESLSPISMIEAIHSAGASLESRDTLGSLPIHYAIKNGSFDRQEWAWFIKTGIGIRAQDHEGRTPLHIAAYYDHEFMINPLIEHDASILDRDYHGNTPIHHCTFAFVHACSTRAAWPTRTVPWPTRAAQMLLRHGASEDVTNSEGRSPIHLVLLAALGSPQNLLAILNHRPELVRVRVPPKDSTLLHMAAARNVPRSSLDILLERKIRREELDRDRKTAVQVAHPDAKRYLVSRGARWLD